MKFVTNFLTAFFLALLLGFLSTGTSHAATVTLSGTITEATSSAAVENATVDVLELNTTTVVETTTTDSNGDYSLSFDDGIYDVRVTPASGSGLTSAINLSKNISASKDVDFELVPSDTITISGTLYDTSGNTLSGVTVQLRDSDGNDITQMNTDGAGEFSFEQPNGSYRLNIFGSYTNDTTPQGYQLSIPVKSYTQSVHSNITLPTKTLSVHVQDGDGNPVSNAKIKTDESVFQTGLSVGSGITASGSNGYTSNDLNTDVSGNVTVYLYPGSNSYNIIATPPDGSGLGQTTHNITIGSNESITITLPQSITISGTVHDIEGNTLEGATVQLRNSGNNNIAQDTTNSSGEFSFEQSEGTYKIYIFGSFTTDTMPQAYNITIPLHAYTDDVNYDDITLPTKTLTIHVQDFYGNSVRNVTLKTDDIINQNNLLLGNGITGSGGSGYPGNGFTTDASGSAIMYLYPGTNSYDIIATPPGGSIYGSETLNDYIVTNNQTTTIILGYSHARPVTTEILSPAPYANGEYKGTITASLSAVPADGYTIAHTYYTVDGGDQQTYSAPFTISGVGEHEIVYWSIDNSGVREANKTKDFTISTPPIITLTSIADTFIKDGNPNDNEGLSTIMRVRQSGHNRALVKFSEPQIQAAVGDSENFTAKLRLTVTDNQNNWSIMGRTLDAHRLTKNWAEGNGYIAENFPSTRGTGNGATWNCAIDTAIQNQTANCSGTTAWDMLNSNSWPFSATPSATATLLNNQSGMVEFDVTADVHAFLDGTANYGWIVKKTNEGQAGSVSFGAKESIYDPQLVITRN